VAYSEILRKIRVVRTAGNPGEIRTANLRNTNVCCYRYTEVLRYKSKPTQIHVLVTTVHPLINVHEKV